jgi:hypothetical protein
MKVLILSLLLCTFLCLVCEFTGIWIIKDNLWMHFIRGPVLMMISMYIVEQLLDERFP